jgi:Mrp family chromosome partitioning ATPase
LRKLKTQQRGRLITGLNALIQNYDLVFIDSGTILDDEAAVSLLPTADQVLFVGRSGATTRSEVANAMEILEPAGRRLTGTVLTMSQGGAA